jgi:H+/Cl- antiporter ClcA
MRKFLKQTGYYLSALLKWLMFAAVTGVLCGIVGSAFHVGVAKATALRTQYPWLLFFLPAAGLLIVATYKIMHTEGQGTNDIISAVSSGKKVSILLIPSIFIGTVLTHLCGGSAGREGAALQMGGGIGYHVGRLFRMDERDIRMATMCGMGAFFSALFGTPLAATMFAIMVVSVGVLYHAAFIPCFTASMISYGVSLLIGVKPTRFLVAAPSVTAEMMARVMLLGALCALVSILFCNAIHKAEHVLKEKIKNSWIRIVLGGAIVIVLSLLSGTADYNGAGMDVIARAIEEGSARPEAFLLKILLTAITLGAGYKGGEVVPSFFVGAVFGCAVSPSLGIPAGFGAAVGLVSVFCGATNCPISSIFLSIELFGADGVLFFAMASGISYILSGYNGLYSSQKILYSKIKAQYINVRTNSHEAGDLDDIEQTEWQPGQKGGK